MKKVMFGYTDKPHLLRCVLGLILLMLVLLLGGLSLFLPLPPYGRYRAEGIGNIGEAYYEFSGGKVSFIMTDGYGSGATAQAKTFGSYYSSNGVWFIVAKGDLGELHPTLWNIKICDTNGAHAATFRRMLSLP